MSVEELTHWGSTYPELACDALFTFHPVLVPAVLRTEDYALAVPEEELRVERKLAVFGRPRRRITVVMGSAALSAAVASVDVMERQRSHLCDLSRGGDVDVRVVLRNAGLPGGFTLLDFDDPGSPAVLRVGTRTGTGLSDEADVAEYRRHMTSLARESIPVREFL